MFFGGRGLRLAQERVEGPAAAGVVAAGAAVGEEGRVGAAGRGQGVGKDREAADAFGLLLYNASPLLII